MSDRFRLDRFVAAQDAGVYEQALRELRAGAKRSHWMWFIFPQIAGLGRSETARFYAIGSREEAIAYLMHPLLGPRLRTCVDALLSGVDRSAEAIFGSIDAMKLRSSLTLFAEVSGEPRFAEALARFFGAPDDATRRLLGAEASRAGTTGAHGHRG